MQERKRGLQKDRDTATRSGWADMLTNQRQMGATLLGIGLVLTLMGIMLFFEGNLLRLGNVCILLANNIIPQIVHSNTIVGPFYVAV